MSIFWVNRTLPGVFDPAAATPNVSVVTFAESGLFYILERLTEKFYERAEPKGEVGFLLSRR